MNKSELVTAVAEKLAGGEPDARQYVDAVFDTIMSQVATGERVQIIGFGTFDSIERAAHVGHNPRSGQAIQVPANVAPRFQAGQTFRAQVKESRGPSADAAAEVAAVEAATVAAAKKTQKPAKVEKVAKPAKTEKPVKITKTAKAVKTAKAEPVAAAVPATVPVKVKDAKDAKAVKDTKSVKAVKTAKTAAKKPAKPAKSGRK